MHIYTIISTLLTLTFLITGGMKLYLPKEKIIANGGAWAETFTEPFIKLLGVIEVICGLGIGIGGRFPIPPIIYIFFISIIMVLMLGASFMHYQRKEYPLLTGTLVLLAMTFYILYNDFLKFL